MDTLFLQRSLITGILKVQIPCHIVSVFTVRFKFPCQHLNSANRILYRVNITLVSRNYTHLAIAAVLAFFHRNYAGKSIYAVNYRLKVHIRASCLYGICIYYIISQKLINFKSKTTNYSHKILTKCPKCAYLHTMPIGHCYNSKVFCGLNYTFSQDCSLSYTKRRNCLL